MLPSCTYGILCASGTVVQVCNMIIASANNHQFKKNMYQIPVSVSEIVVNCILDYYMFMVPKDNRKANYLISISAF